MTFKLQLREDRPATIAEHRALRDEIARLKEQLSHGTPAIEELTKEREMYRMRWLGSMTPEEAVLIRAENERLRQAASEVLDIFDQGDTSEAWQVAMLKLRTALGIVGRTYEQSQNQESKNETP